MTDDRYTVVALGFCSAPHRQRTAPAQNCAVHPVFMLTPTICGTVVVVVVLYICMCVYVYQQLIQYNMRLWWRKPWSKDLKKHRGHLFCWWFVEIKMKLSSPIEPHIKRNYTTKGSSISHNNASLNTFMHTTTDIHTNMGLMLSCRHRREHARQKRWQWWPAKLNHLQGDLVWEYEQKNEGDIWEKGRKRERCTGDGGRGDLIGPCDTEGVRWDDETRG